MHKILLTEPENYSVEAKTLLKQIFIVDEDRVSYKGLLQKVGQYFGLLIRLDLRIDETVLDQARKLKFIGTPTTGEDHIDVDLAKMLGIRIISLKGERAFLNEIYATAEHTFGLLLAIMRKIPFAFNDVCCGKWRKEHFKGNELNGKTFGIIGFGRLGVIVARYASTFGMKVLACDIVQKKISDVEMVSIEEICRRADIISIHVNYTKQNHKMINSKHFDLMKDEAIFINASRGQLVDEVALLDALRLKPGFRAALDVIDDENNNDHLKKCGLIEHMKNNSNLLITPHIGGYAEESIKKTRDFIAKKACDFVMDRAKEGV